jgi:hypothetical protein
VLTRYHGDDFRPARKLHFFGARMSRAQTRCDK